VSCTLGLSVALPDLSALLPSLPDLPLAVHIPGLPIPCCNLPPLLSLKVTIPLSAIMPLILASLGPVGFESLMASIKTAQDQLNALLAQIPPINCPLE
jgi:hypothetical protein